VPRNENRGSTINHFRISCIGLCSKSVLSCRPDDRHENWKYRSTNLEAGLITYAYWSSNCQLCDSFSSYPFCFAACDAGITKLWLEHIAVHTSCFDSKDVRLNSSVYRPRAKLSSDRLLGDVSGFAEP
jgi:hypothetical protein